MQRCGDTSKKRGRAGPRGGSRAQRRRRGLREGGGRTREASWTRVVWSKQPEKRSEARRLRERDLEGHFTQEDADPDAGVAEPPAMEEAPVPEEDAPGDGGVDFVSRFFMPNCAVPEDPVTGSSHCTLIPYWAQRLGRTTLQARQLSARGGDLFCEHAGERVKIAGHAVLYLRGEIEV